MVDFTVLSFVLGLLTVCKSQGLAVEYLSARLPTGDHCHQLHYDGDDSIFVFGGCWPRTARQILKYTLATDTISRIGTLPTDFIHGSVQSDDDGNVFLFGSGGINSS